MAKDTRLKNVFKLTIAEMSHSDWPEQVATLLMHCCLCTLVDVVLDKINAVL